MNREQILEQLAKPDLPFVQKLRFAANLEIDLWEDRQLPNLGENEFKKLLYHIPTNVTVSWLPRESVKGKHGSTGDDNVFKFEFTIRLLGFETAYFVKGYFFDKGACQGVCLQSFREIRRTKIIKLMKFKR